MERLSLAGCDPLLQDPLTDIAFAVRSDLGEQMAKLIARCGNPTQLLDVDAELQKAHERLVERRKEIGLQLARLHNVPLFEAVAV